MGILRIDERRCTGCTVCFDVCPMDVIRMDDEAGKAYVKYLRDCQSCFLCETLCPEEAIYVSPARERRIPLPW